MSKVTVKELYLEFKENTANEKYHAKRLKFTGVGNRDVYNITAPFQSNGKAIIAGRVEGRDTEYSSVMFFEEKDNIWSPVKGAPVFSLQDPCITKINGELILGGVEVFDHPTLKGNLWWRTVFFRGEDVFNLQRFAEGPNGMKDLRLFELDEGRIGVFTRPQHPEGKIGSLGGRGKIGYAEIDGLSNLNPKNIEKATILEQISEEDWLGANEIHKLDDGLLGVLAHVAMYDSNRDRHYYPAAFTFNSITKTPSEIKIIAERKMFVEGPSKATDLADVVFSGGLVRKGNRAELYVGTGDTEAQVIEIDDPFMTD